MWPELKLVHGDAAHSSTVDRDNAEKMLYSWMEDNKTTRWSRGLKFVQFMKNRSLHSGKTYGRLERISSLEEEKKIGLRNWLGKKIKF